MGARLGRPASLAAAVFGICSRRVQPGSTASPSPPPVSFTRGLQLLTPPLLCISLPRSLQVSEVMNLIGDVRGKVAVLVDDMIDTAGEAGSCGPFSLARVLPCSGCCCSRAGGWVSLAADPSRKAVLVAAQPNPVFRLGALHPLHPASTHLRPSLHLRHHHQCCQGAACGGGARGVCLRHPRRLLAAGC